MDDHVERAHGALRLALLETKASPETMRLFETIVELRVGNSSRLPPTGHGDD
jgi:hypothetical protein